MAILYVKAYIAYICNKYNLNKNTMANFKDLEIIEHSQETEIVNCNILGVKVATNGYCGGDSGHGSRTYFKLEDLASTDINIRLLKDKKGVEMMLGGDAELETFIQALRWAADNLEEMAKK